MLDVQDSVYEECSRKFKKLQYIINNFKAAKSAFKGVIRSNNQGDAQHYLILAGIDVANACELEVGLLIGSMLVEIGVSGDKGRTHFVNALKGVFSNQGSDMRFMRLMNCGTLPELVVGISKFTPLLRSKGCVSIDLVGLWADLSMRRGDLEQIKLNWAERFYAKSLGNSLKPTNLV